MNRTQWPLWTGIFLLIFTVLFLVAVFPARAHHAPSGWAYPFACCSKQDCRPVECDSLEEIGDGKVRDIENGQTYDKDKVFSSGDSHCHICTTLGRDDGAPICVFIQQNF